VSRQIDLSLESAVGLDRYREVESGSVIARGVNYGTAFEIALKIRELSGVPFEAFSAADLLHGPIAALKAGRPAIVIAPSGLTLASLREAVDKVRERGADVVAISDDSDFLEKADVAVPLTPNVPEWLSPLVTVIPGQVAAVRLATLRGEDVDSPMGLTKITLTR
jgi:glucosamine--fructose-6-phosphate aminotransferase (isomerizing)